jgi:glycogen debranching enzyme
MSQMRKPAGENIKEKAKPEIILLPGEEILEVKDIKAPDPEKNISSLEWIKKLTKAKTLTEVGNKGPALASLSTEKSKGIKELRYFEALFGRDSLRVATDLLPFFPKLARTTLLRLAEFQGTKIDDIKEEEPGKIIHEYREPNDEVGIRIKKQKGLDWPYYGSVDSTPMFIRLVCDYSNTEDKNFLDHEVNTKNGKKTMRNVLGSAVGWLERKLEQSPDGVLEFKRVNPGGLENQAWKDRWDSYFHKDGSMPNHKNGIASIEVQGLAYEALLSAAEAFEKSGNESDKVKAGGLRKRAEKLKAKIISEFWIEEDGRGYFALGADRDKNGKLRLMKIKTSNMGHLLNTGLLDGDDKKTSSLRKKLVGTLFSKEMMAPNGIRTLSSKEVRYRPFAYQNGSVWFWDNYQIARGLRRHGFIKEAKQIEDKILKVVNKLNSFPEFARGDDHPDILNKRVVWVMDKINNRKNRIEQPPQEIQAWTVSSVLGIKYERGRKKK